MGVKQVVDVHAIANNHLPAVEKQFKRLRNDTSILQFRKQTCERNLYQVNKPIGITRRFLNSFHILCKRERREIELLSEKTRQDNCSCYSI